MQSPFQKTRITALSLLLTALLAFTGCATGRGAAPEEVVKSDKHRIVSPNVPAQDMQALVNDNTAFAVELYKSLRGEGENLFFSPLSISIALSMTYGGARGETAAQMSDVLHFNLPAERLHSAFNALDQALASRGSIDDGEEGEPFSLNVVNALWGQQGYAFQELYLDLLALNYGAGMTLMDFMADPEGSRQRINQWVSDQTAGKIKDLIPERAISAMTRLVLTNAVYFKASWKHPFETVATTPGPFVRKDQSEVTAQMMRQTEYFKYYRGGNYQAVALPYKGDELDMVLVLPDVDGFESVEESLSAGLISELTGGLRSAEIDLSLPRFSFKSGFPLKEQLKALGMRDAFEPGNADLSGIDGTRALYISEVIHKAFVGIDEKGTEAAAATAVIVCFSGVPSPKTVKFNRPFIFFIRDRATNTVLFIGRVLDPSAA